MPSRQAKRPEWAIVEMHFTSQMIGEKPHPPKTIYIYSATLAYVEPDGRCWSHQLSKDSVPDGHAFDNAYLIGFTNEPPFATPTPVDNPEAAA